MKDFAEALHYPVYTALFFCFNNYILPSIEAEGIDIGNALFYGAILLLIFIVAYLRIKMEKRKKEEIKEVED